MSRQATRHSLDPEVTARDLRRFAGTTVYSLVIGVRELGCPAMTMGAWITVHTVLSVFRRG